MGDEEREMAVSGETEYREKEEGDVNGDKKEIYEEKRTFTRAELAEFLRQLAAQIESGAVTAGGQTVQLPEVLKTEFELEEKGGRMELEVEVKWGG